MSWFDDLVANAASILTPFLKPPESSSGSQQQEEETPADYGVYTSYPEESNVLPTTQPSSQQSTQQQISNTPIQTTKSTTTSTGSYSGGTVLSRSYQIDVARSLASQNQPLPSNITNSDALYAYKLINRFVKENPNRALPTLSGYSIGTTDQTDAWGLAMAKEFGKLGYALPSNLQGFSSYVSAYNEGKKLNTSSNIVTQAASVLTPFLTPSKSKSEQLEIAKSAALSGNLDLNYAKLPSDVKDEDAKYAYKMISRFRENGYTLPELSGVSIGTTAQTDAWGLAMAKEFGKRGYELPSNLQGFTAYRTAYNEGRGVSSQYAGQIITPITATPSTGSQWDVLMPQNVTAEQQANNLAVQRLSEINTAKEAALNNQPMPSGINSDAQYAYKMVHRFKVDLPDRALPEISGFSVGTTDQTDAWALEMTKEFARRGWALPSNLREYDKYWVTYDNLVAELKKQQPVSQPNIIQQAVSTISGMVTGLSKSDQLTKVQELTKTGASITNDITDSDAKYAYRMIMRFKESPDFELPPIPYNLGTTSETDKWGIEMVKQFARMGYPIPQNLKEFPLYVSAYNESKAQLEKEIAQAQPDGFIEGQATPEQIEVLGAAERLAEAERQKQAMIAEANQVRLSQIQSAYDAANSNQSLPSSILSSDAQYAYKMVRRFKVDNPNIVLPQITTAKLGTTTETEQWAVEMVKEFARLGYPIPENLKEYDKYRVPYEEVKASLPKQPTIIETITEGVAGIVAPYLKSPTEQKLEQITQAKAAAFAGDDLPSSIKDTDAQYIYKIVSRFKEDKSIELPPIPYNLTTIAEADKWGIEMAKAFADWGYPLPNNLKQFGSYVNAYDTELARVKEVARRLETEGDEFIAAQVTPEQIAVLGAAERLAQAEKEKQAMIEQARLEGYKLVADKWKQGGITLPNLTTTSASEGSQEWQLEMAREMAKQGMALPSSITDSAVKEAWKQVNTFATASSMFIVPSISSSGAKWGTAQWIRDMVKQLAIEGIPLPKNLESDDVLRPLYYTTKQDTDYQKQLKDRASAQLATFESNINKFNTDAKQYESDVKTYSDNIEKYKVLQAKATDYAAKVTSFNVEVESFNTKKADYEKRLADYENEVKSVNAELSNIQGYSDEVTKYNQAVEDFNNSIAGKQYFEGSADWNKLQSKIAELKDWQNRISAQVPSWTMLQSRSDSIEAQRQSLINEQNQINNELLRLQQVESQLDSEAPDATQLEQLYNELKSKQEELNAKLNELTSTSLSIDEQTRIYGEAKAIEEAKKKAEEQRIEQVRLNAMIPTTLVDWASWWNKQLEKTFTYPKEMLSQMAILPQTPSEWGERLLTETKAATPILRWVTDINQLSKEQIILSAVEDLANVGMIAMGLAAPKIASAVNIEPVKISTTMGEVTLWRGLDINGKPIVGVSNGKIMFGKGGLELPEASAIKSGWQPITKVETEFLGTPEAMRAMGLTETEITKLMATLETRAQFAGKISPYLDETALPTELKSMSESGFNEVLKTTVEYGDKIQQVYGSTTIKAQLAPELQSWRQPADVDIMTKLSADDAAIFAKEIVAKLEKTEGAGNVRVSADRPQLVETLSKEDGTWHHAVDIHSTADLEGGTGSPQAAEGAYGMLHAEPSVTINVDGVGKIEIMRLSESGKRKAASITEWQNVSDKKLMYEKKLAEMDKDVADRWALENDYDPTNPDLIKISPAEHRMKDITDYYVILRTFKGAEVADSWAKAYGYDPAELLTKGTENPPTLETWRFSPSTSKGTGSATITVAMPASVATMVAGTDV
ncbi:MAG: hypothetical protein WC499_04070, partial [Patescibacteria group bacterium]